MAAGANASAPLPKPRLIGRLVRLILGVLLLYFFAEILRAIPSQAHGFLATRSGWGSPGGDWWIAAIVCFLALPTFVNEGFGRHWGGWPRVAFLLLAAGAILWDWVAYGAFWAWPLAVLVFLLVAYMLAHAGISYLVAACAATPG